MARYLGGLNLVEGVQHHDDGAHGGQDVDRHEGEAREVENDNRNAVDDEEQEAAEDGALDEVLHRARNVGYEYSPPPPCVSLGSDSTQPPLGPS